jgi:hypothetical protein
MKVFLLPNGGGKRLVCRVPYPEANHAVVQGAKCVCGAEPFKVQGAHKRIASDDRAYEADAVCPACGAHVGILRAEVETLFGLREDRAVLEGRFRVY